VLLDPTGRPAAPGARSYAESEEAARLLALHRYAVLDTQDEAAFDRITALARDLYDVPIALVSLVDATRQWFKSRIGIEIRETPRTWSLCTYAILAPSGPVFVLPDALADPRFATNPLVTGEPYVRFYAGAPMVTPDGHAIGTVSIVSPRPRPAGLNEREQERLRMLADIAMDELELRLQLRLRAHAIEETEAARQREERLRRAQEAAGVVAFEFGPGGASEASGALRALYGLPPGEAITFQDLLAHVHPEDRAWLARDHARLVAGGGSFEHEYRVVHPDGRVCWLHARGTVAVPADRPGVPPQRTLGVVFDVTARRRAEERQALLAREVDHRARNALALVQAALRLTPVDDPAAYARAVEGRVAALARAQTLLARAGWAGTGLRALAEAELGPFLASPAAAGADEAPGAPEPPSGGGGGDGPRARLDGPALVIAPYAVQPLSMALHELATNAAKYGALSAPGGRVALRWRLIRRAGGGQRAASDHLGNAGNAGPAGDAGPPEPALVLAWVESGGPKLAGPPSRRGFGSRVLETVLRSQLSGQMRQYWLGEGLRVVIALPGRRVLAEAS